jgi:hypothetical protein
MTGDWYYSHGGSTHGPFSMEEIREHAARKQLLESDLVWQGSRGPDSAIVAEAALDFSNLPVTASPAPDWLKDIAQDERKGPVPGPLPSKESPDWLDDLRVWIALDLYASAQASRETGTLQTAAIPDWLESWLEPAAPATGPAAQSAAPSVQEHAKKADPAPKPEDALAEKAMVETGFDLKTGQILDPERFRRWQKESHSKQTAITNESLFETFRKARTAVENWVDADEHVSLILAGDLSAVKQDARLQAIFQQYEGFGLSMQQKLVHHLEFMVENRRKYYAALARR